MRELSLAETAAVLAVQRLQQSYGDIVTRRAWTEMAELFERGATVTIDTRTRPVVDLEAPEELVAFVASSLERFAFFELAVLSSTVALDGDDATGRVYICEQRCTPAGEWTTAYGLYQDRYHCTGDDWRVAHRRYHSLARTGPPVEVFPLPSID